MAKSIRPSVSSILPRRAGSPATFLSFVCSGQGAETRAKAFLALLELRRLLLAAAGGLLSTALWASLSTQVAGGLFYFPHGGADALLHLGTSTIFLAGAAHYYATSRRRTASP